MAILLSDKVDIRATTKIITLDINFCLIYLIFFTFYTFYFALFHMSGKAAYRNTCILRQEK